MRTCANGESWICKYSMRSNFTYPDVFPTSWPWLECHLREVRCVLIKFSSVCPLDLLSDLIILVLSHLTYSRGVDIVWTGARQRFFESFRDPFKFSSLCPRDNQLNNYIFICRYLSPARFKCISIVLIKFYPPKNLYLHHSFKVNCISAQMPDSTLLWWFGWNTRNIRYVVSRILLFNVYPTEI